MQDDETIRYIKILSSGKHQPSQLLPESVINLTDVITQGPACRRNAFMSLIKFWEPLASTSPAFHALAHRVESGADLTADETAEIYVFLFTSILHFEDDVGKFYRIQAAAVHRQGAWDKFVEQIRRGMVVFTMRQTLPGTDVLIYPTAYSFALDMISAYTSCL